jgi:hypothetical protein
VGALALGWGSPGDVIARRGFYFRSTVEIAQTAKPPQYDFVDLRRYLL